MCQRQNYSQLQVHYILTFEIQEFLKWKLDIYFSCDGFCRGINGLTSVSKGNLCLCQKLSEKWYLSRESVLTLVLSLPSSWFFSCALLTLALGWHCDSTCAWRHAGSLVLVSPRGHHDWCWEHHVVSVRQKGRLQAGPQ